VPSIGLGLEHLHPLTGDEGAPQTADQFFALARKHASGDNF
jgi:hypothetical protein